MDDFISDEPQPAAAPTPPTPSLPFRRPADFYAGVGPEPRPLFARWVPVGCGWAAVAFVILLFVAGTLAPRAGWVLDKLFGKIGDDIVSHFQHDVTPAQKAAFAGEMKTLQASAAAGKLKLDRTQSFLRLATEVDGDEKIDHAEADKLIASVREVNRMK